jgi:hypothetical protein
VLHLQFQKYHNLSCTLHKAKQPSVEGRESLFYLTQCVHASVFLQTFELTAHSRAFKSGVNISSEMDERNTYFIQISVILSLRKIERNEQEGLAEIVLE